MNGNRIADAVVTETMTWLETPYRHQGRRKGVGCNCIGLVLGVWRAVHGGLPERPGPYAADWAEAGGSERLLEAARRHFVEKPRGAMAPGDVMVFRWRPHLQAKHAGILIGAGRFVHAYEGMAVSASVLAPQWRRRIAGVFAFPEHV
ncbi:NlpC/P60 family protein [Mesorhizobium marinum]|uniref:NlpC/P60 family protein n=1 Tax=Mesorhizobium marinum TaxID=3228790 RepID=A0ABV3R186_9HYPH